MPYKTFSINQTLSLSVSLSLYLKLRIFSYLRGGGRVNFLEENPFGIFFNSGSSSGCEGKSSIVPPRMENEVGQKDQKRSRKKAVTSGNGGDCVGDESDGHDQIHIWTERERRKKMRNMFSNLHSLLPDLPPKADKSTIVDEAVKYIKTLEQTLQALQKKKLEKLKHPSMAIKYDISSNSTSLTEEPESREAFMSKQGSLMAENFSPRPFGFRPFYPACFQTWFSPNVVMNMCGDDAQISICSQKKTGLLAAIFYILEKHQIDVVSSHIFSDHYRNLFMIHAHAGGSEQFVDLMPAEEVFKLAVGEINLWILNC